MKSIDHEGNQKKLVVMANRSKNQIGKIIIASLTTQQHLSVW